MVHLQNNNPGIPGTILTDIPVSASTTTIVDSIPAAYNLSVKWIITATDLTNNKMQVSEVLALNKFNTTIKHNQYGRIGDKIQFNVDVVLSTGNIELEIENNESNALNFNVVRIQTVA